MTFNHIFVPFDGSNYSKHAFHTALGIALKFGSKITVTTCLISMAEEDEIFMEEHARILDRQKNKIMEELKELQTIAISNKIIIEVHTIVCTSIIEAIVTFVNSHKVDLVVMGTRGKTRFRPLLVGSVSIGVSQHVECPVLLVK